MEYKLVARRGGGSYQDRVREYFLETDMPLEAVQEKVNTDFPFYANSRTMLPIPQNRVSAIHGGYKIELIEPFTD